MALITKPVFVALLKSRPKRGPLPRQQPPDRIRERYTKRLQEMMSWLMGRVRVELYPVLRELTDSASRVATTDASFTKLTPEEFFKLSAEERSAYFAREREAAQAERRWKSAEAAAPDARAERQAAREANRKLGAARITPEERAHLAAQGFVERTEINSRVNTAASFAGPNGELLHYSSTNSKQPWSGEAYKSATFSNVESAVEHARTLAQNPELMNPRHSNIGEKIDALRAEFDERFSRRKLGALVEPFAQQTADFQAVQLNAQLREAVAVDVVGGEPWLARAATEFTRENVALIRTIPERFFGEIETLVMREAADGARWETLVDGIEERYDVSRSRSKIIARDQVGKFYGDLNRVRQTDLGITRFVWRTVRDNRVRPEHADIDGQSFEWGSAPDGGPGEAVLCRCYADPDLSSVTA